MLDIVIDDKSLKFLKSNTAFKTVILINLIVLSLIILFDFDYYIISII